jgi:hypothetical protein
MLGAEYVISVVSLQKVPITGSKVNGVISGICPCVRAEHADLPPLENSLRCLNRFMAVKACFEKQTHTTC